MFLMKNLHMHDIKLFWTKCVSYPEQYIACHKHLKYLENYRMNLNMGMLYLLFISMPMKIKLNSRPYCSTHNHRGGNHLTEFSILNYRLDRNNWMSSRDATIVTEGQKGQLWWEVWMFVSTEMFGRWVYWKVWQLHS